MITRTSSTKFGATPGQDAGETEGECEGAWDGAWEEDADGDCVGATDSTPLVALVAFVLLLSATDGAMVGRSVGREGESDGEDEGDAVGKLEFEEVLLGVGGCVIKAASEGLNSIR